MAKVVCTSYPILHFSKKRGNAVFIVCANNNLLCEIISC